MKTSGINKAPEKILIIKPSSLGDIVQSLAFLDAVKRKFQQAKVHWVVAKGFEGLLERHPLIEKLWVINKDDWKNLTKLHTTIIGLKRLFKDLKAEQFDYVIDLQGLLRSGLIAKATGSSVRIGFKEAREGSKLFYTHKVEVGKDTHAVDKYLKVAAFLGCNINNISFPFPPALRHLDEILPLPEIYLRDYAVIVPGARWKTKRWPAIRFGKLAAGLTVKSIVVGSKSDMFMADEVVRASEGNAISLAGRTDISSLIEVIRHANFVVCNDTGPMHIAAALGVHVFAIFGPSNPDRTGPYGRNSQIIRKDISCAPCYKRTCTTMECMDLIKAEDISILISEFLRISDK